MGGCDGGRMNPQMALRHRSLMAWPPTRFLSAIVLVALLSAGLLWSCWPVTDHAPEASSIEQLVRWQDAEHDWLLVIDPDTSELVVYDANDGRPLERLGADDGLPDVRSIVQQGPWLFVIGTHHPKVRLLKLPQLRLVAFDGR
jgi:hypothetical protein